MANEAEPKYEVTATKRRPKTFDELAGQDFVVSTLKSSLESGHIAHAYLFSGPRGCGKTSAARILARSLNCEKGPTIHPCGVCSNCREISAGSSLDVIEIDGASNTGVNDVRQIKEEVLFPPNAGRYKVYIIDEVHMLSTSAFNALLKTIEEPPPRVIFIFATTELHKVPATIKSRCQQFAFRLIPVETIRDILRDICGEMKVEAEEDALFWIARESTGSLRDAFTLFDQVISFSAGHIRSALIREKLGLVGFDKLNDLAEACAGSNASRAFALIDEILAAGVAIEQFVIDLASYFRSLLLIKNGVTRESLLGCGPERFSARAREFDSVRLEQGLKLLLDCYRDIRYSVSPRFELETVISKLSWLGRWVSPPELADAIDGVRSALGIRPGVEAPALGGNQTLTGGQAPSVQEPSGGRTFPSRAHDQVFSAPAQDSPAGFRGGDDQENPEKTGSLTEGFKRIVAAREQQDPVLKSGAGTVGGPHERENAPPGDAPAQGSDEDVPLWSSYRDRPEEKTEEAAEDKTDPQTQNVLRLFRGTMVKDSGADNEH
jgi:DNA polymerase-3 subunit gamma/tau